MFFVLETHYIARTTYIYLCYKIMAFKMLKGNFRTRNTDPAGTISCLCSQLIMKQDSHAAYANRILRSFFVMAPVYLSGENS